MILFHRVGNEQGNRGRAGDEERCGEQMRGHWRQQGQLGTQSAGVSVALGPCAGRNQGLAVLRREDDSGAGGLRRARRAMLYGTEARDNTSMG
ncbi:hypothetical protein QG37_04658 [Candidozyma auris]|uniref:Uncharacterized protein n=1 Tax=Candidozyma auris TaxID=498019 RepID=A0A0L0NX18_CANAR|nr:hypothetical protein QG37_04658 [[Candida] auris]